MRHEHILRCAERGELLRFSYPERNRLGICPLWKPRTIVVESLTDTLREPIDPLAVEIEPLTRRGRWLVTGWDVELGAQRSFYWEAMRGVESAAWLALSVYDPCGADPCPLRPRGLFAPTQRDRLFLADVLRRFRRRTAKRRDLWMNAAVFPVEPEAATEVVIGGDRDG